MINISFLGDISFNNGYNDLFRNKINPFENVSNILLNSNLVVGNLECFAESNEGENALKIPRLKTNIETLNYLNNINIGITTLANNHLYDNLADGFFKTIAFLKECKIDYMGAGINEFEYSTPYIKTFDEISLGFLNYVTQDTNPSLPENALISPNFYNKEKAFSDIKKIKNTVNFVIILIHWGGRVEGGFYPDQYQPIMARELIDAGADLIVGHHSHTFQPFEKYKGKYIFYSLGNFCFDDITYQGRIFSNLNKRRKQSAILNIDFKEEDYEINIHPFINNDLILIPNKGLKFIFLFRNLIYKFIKLSKLFWRLYFFKLKKINPVFDYFFVHDGSFIQKIQKIKISEILRFIKK
jgi:hypothetical protein